MRISDLDVKNVRGVRHVHIRPVDDKSVVVIAGRNGQGKSSTLEAIALALGGRPALAANPKPVRDGEETAQVVVTLDDGTEGQLVVTRRWTAGGENTTLKVVKDGFKAERGQATLDTFLGNMTFDPLAWIKSTARDQRATLLGSIALPFDLDELDAKRRLIFEERTIVNREVTKLEGQVAGAVIPPDDTPDTEVSMAELLAKIEAARATEAEVTALFEASRAADEHVRACEAEIERLKALLGDAEAQLNEARADAERAGEAADTAPLVVVNDGTGDTIVQQLTDQLSTLEATNAAVRAKLARDQLVAELGRTTRESDRLTSEIGAIDVQKRQALHEAVMPVDGLSVTDDDVLFNGRPLKQCSTSEQLRVSVAVAMAADPKIRIIRIADGNDLDSDGLRLIAEMAEANDFQVWLELVSEDPDGDGFYIEAGQLAGATTDTEEPTDG